MTLIPGCRESIARMTDLDEGALGAGERLRVWLHLVVCPPCRKLRGSLRALPGILREAEGVPEAPPQAHAALAWALQNLGRPPQPRLAQPTPVPESLARELDTGEPSLALQARVHRALFQGRPRGEAPRVPEAALAELPPVETWRWRRLPFSRVKIATLAQEAGKALVVMVAPPNYRYPAHVHLGAESVLVLDGELDDPSGHLGNGDWVTYEAGSRHAPMAGDEGCWTLVRIEGGFRHVGLFGRLRDMFL